MIHVMAVVTTEPGLRDQLLEMFRTNVAAVHAEEGCIEYGAAIDMDSGKAFQTLFGPDVMLVIEKWTSLEALENHLKTPHMLAYAAKVRPMIASRVIHVLTPETPPRSV